jgi:hypothetical protein
MNFSKRTDAVRTAMSEEHNKKSSGLGTDLVKLTIGVGSSFANLVFPGAGMAGPFLNFAIDRYVKRPQKLLVDEIRAQEITEPSEEMMVRFVPMAYRYFEAAKEGEYEHNLRVLASYIAKELKQEAPDPPRVARMARRLEGLTKIELKVIALINSSMTSPTKKLLPSSTEPERPYVSAYVLEHDPNNEDNFDRWQLAEALTELASRGLLIPDGAARLDKGEEYYFASQAFIELVDRARETIEEINAEPQEESSGTV